MGGIDHLECLCTFNSERPILVGETSYLSQCYRVPAEDIKVDPTLVQKEEAQSSNEKPVLKEVKKKVQETPELDEGSFPAGPYQEVSLTELDLCDIVTTSSHVKTFYEVRENKGAYITTKCIYSRAFPKRIGEEYTLTTAYLVERAARTSQSLLK